MKVLFITAHPYLPQMRGGLQQSADALISALRKRGHDAAMLCALMPNGYVGMSGRVKIKLSRQKAASDSVNGYPVYRAWFPWEAVDEVVKKEKPDVIVVLARMPVKMALAARKTGVPIVMMLQDVEFKEHGGDFKQLWNVPCAANSQFTARKYYDEYGVEPQVIHPLVYPEKYLTKTSREQVTFINPNPTKGLDIALAVAAQCPDIPFTFVESWPLTDEQLAALNEKISSLKNVTLQRAVPDMRTIYAKTKILLVPSKWEEAYGRVASEVQISGIPVVASDRGGLPEAVGQGGVLLNPEGDVSLWVEAVRKLWSDDVYYHTLSKEAEAHARRPQLNVEHQIGQWESILLDVAQNQKKSI